MAKHSVYFVIDFDSTFVTVEAFDELARIVLKNDPQKEEKVKKIEKITAAAMEGRLSFTESLRSRFALIAPKRQDIDQLIRLLKTKITPSVKSNKAFFSSFADQIYLVSGGFSDYIWPIVKEYGLAQSHVLANTFIYDREGNITSYDTTNPLSNSGGKAIAVQKLKLDGDILVIGDGYTDYEIKAAAGKSFFAFTENVRRESLLPQADHVIRNFDELLHIMRLPRSMSYPKSKMKVLLLENIDQSAVKRFKKEGYLVESLPNALSENELIEKIKDVSILGVRSKSEVTQKVLDSAARLLAIGAFSVGTNNINLRYAAQKGIAVFNAPFSNTRSVVELTLGLTIMLARRVVVKHEALQKGVWDKSVTYCHEVRGKTLGIIGYGNIGSQLSVIAESLGMKVIFYDVIQRLSLGNAVQCSSLKELLKTSDIITVHVDGRPENHNLIGKKEFSYMKKGALFINISRGTVVDINAFAEAVKSGHLGGGSADVFPVEPKGKQDKFESPLRGLENVILTPHIGGNTVEAQEGIGEFVSQRLSFYVDSGATMMSVNIPQLDLPAMKGVHRLIHIHKNVPGVLAKLNNLLAQEKVNIEGQYLKTNEDIGYVITDINKQHPPFILARLRSMDETIKARILY